MAKLTAVLTGDLVGSTGVETGRVDRSMEEIASAAARLIPASRFTRYRGDGWQMFLPEPHRFLEAAIYLNAVLKSDPASLPTRISIGLGGADNLGGNSLAGASGTAFINSGRALDTMVAGRTLVLSGEATNKIQQSTLFFVEDRIQHWSREQAEVIAMKLTPNPRVPDSWPTQDEMSLALGITRQAVGSRLKAAGWALLLNAYLAFQDHFEVAPDA